MEGLIYKTQPYMENARLLFVYTKRGKVTLMAQGSQKLTSNLRVLSQYLSHIEFEDQNKSFQTLKNAKLLNDYQLIKSDYEKTKQASVILEIIDRVIVEDQNHEQIYNHLIEALNYDTTLSSLSFAIKILRPLGYEVNLEGDGSKVKGIVLSLGSISYVKDQMPVDLNLEETVDFLKLSKLKYQDLESAEIKNKEKIKTFVYKYYEYHIDIQLKNMR